MAQHSDSPGERKVAEMCARFLEENGRKNVRIAFHSGSPGSEEVMLDMNREGVDTFAIVPLSVSEGRKTVWLMPKAMRLPDNCGSWTMIDGKDMATRFATALGPDPDMASALAEREGKPEDGTAIMLLARGSTHSSCARTAEFYADALRKAGWHVECGYSVHGRTVKDAAKAIVDSGFGRIRVVPLFIAFDGRSSEDAMKTLSGFDAEVSYAEPVSRIPIYLNIINNKVPEGWRAPGHTIHPTCTAYSKVRP